MKDGPTISTFMVVKNEELTIERALESVLEITEEYVIGIDDKHNDKTKEIILEFADKHPEKVWKISDYTWKNSFADARNWAIAQCTCDWMLVLDGHEYLLQDSVPVIRQLLNNAQDTLWLISIAIDLELMWPFGIPEVWFLQGRLIRNHVGIKYEGASHNVIPTEVCPDHARVRTPEIRIVHDRPRKNAEERREQRRDMNIPNFLAEVKKDKKSERGWFYLAQSEADAATIRGEDGQLRHDLKRLRRAAKMYKRYLKLFGNKHEQAYEASAKLGEIYGILGKFENARDAFLDCIGHSPQRAESYFYLGQLCMQHMTELGDMKSNGDITQDQYDIDIFNTFIEAERWLKTASEMHPPVTSYFLRAAIYTFLPKLRLAELYASAFRFSMQEEYFMKSIMAYKDVLRDIPYNRQAIKDMESLEQDYDNAKTKGIFRQKAAQLVQTGKKATIAIFNNIGNFTAYLGRRWNNAGYLTSEWNGPDTNAALWGDVLFSSWANQVAITLSKRKWPGKLFIRAERYEIYSNMLHGIEWDNVDGLICVNQALAGYIQDRYMITCPVHVIYHGIEIDRWTYKKRSENDKVAITALFDSRKGLAELAEIIKHSNRKNFYLAGKVKQQDAWRNFWWQLNKAGVQDRVTYCGWQKDMNKWYDEIDPGYLLSCSWSESYAYNIAEAMAKGIRPVIRDFEGRDEIYPDDLSFMDTDTAIDMLNSEVSSADYRAWAEKNFDADREAQEYLTLFFGEQNVNTP